MWDQRFLSLAREISTWSKDPSTKTGAVIVRPNRSVCSVGYNGFPMSMRDEARWYADREEKYSRIIHCEMNALLLSQDRNHEGYTLYTYPFISCDRCFVHMVQAGIKRFVAPRATAEQLTRWGPSFERVRDYAKATNVTIAEYAF